MEKKKLFLTFLLGILLINFISAIDLIKIPDSPIEDKAGFSFDNLKTFTNDSLKYGRVELKNSFLKIIPLGVIEEITLIDNTDLCGNSCYATKDILINTDTKLIDSVKFKKLLENGSWQESSIRNYSLWLRTSHVPYEKDKFIYDCSKLIKIDKPIICEKIKNGTETLFNDTWKEYNYEVMPKGNYTIQLRGEKSLLSTYDWIITSQGIEILDWSVWNGNNIIVNSHDLAFGSSTYSQISGVVITANYNFTLANYTLHPSNTAGGCAIKDNSGNDLNTSAPSNKVCLISYKMVAGSTYRLIVSGSGYAAYESSYNPSTFPINRNSANFVSGWYGTGADTGSAYSVISFTALIDPSSISLTSPADNFSTNTSANNFTASAIVIGGATLTNMSLWDNSTGTFKLNQTLSKTGTSNSSTFTNNYNSGFILWGIQACDSDGACGFSSNRTLNVTLPSTDSCTPTANTNWTVNFNDNCILSSNINLGTGKIIINGNGTLTINSTVTSKGLSITCGNSACKLIVSPLGKLIFSIFFPVALI